MSGATGCSPFPKLPLFFFSFFLSFLLDARRSFRRRVYGSSMFPDTFHFGLACFFFFLFSWLEDMLSLGATAPADSTPAVEIGKLGRGTKVPPNKPRGDIIS